jgi:ATP-dependent Clp protease protease subunit
MQQSTLTLSLNFRYVKPAIFTLCVGNAWGEAALLLTAGAKGNRSALPSSTIMIKQVLSDRFF